MNELLASVRSEMVRLAKELPEFVTVHGMYGVGKTTATQLMAEIGDIHHYPLRSSLVGFAGVDPEIDQCPAKKAARSRNLQSVGRLICGKPCSRSDDLPAAQTR